MKTPHKNKEKHSFFSSVVVKEEIQTKSAPKSPNILRSAVTSLGKYIIPLIGIVQYFIHNFCGTVAGQRVTLLWLCNNVVISFASFDS